MADSLATTPAGTPPPGVKPNFVDPPSGATILIVVGTLLLTIMLVFAGIRFYIKVFVRRQVTADDSVTRGKFGTHMWDISVAHTLSNDFLIASFFTNWPSGLVWAFAKSSFFLMYLQLFGPLRWLRTGVYVGMIVNWLFYTIVVIASFIYQVPNPGQTWQEGFMNKRYQQSFNWTIPIASGSLILDTYILILPIIAILNLQLKITKKLGAIAVFATGLLACVASSLSIYFKYLLDLHLNDYTYWIYPVLLTALVEIKYNGLGSSAFSLLRGLLHSRKYSGRTGGSNSTWRDADSHSQFVGKSHYVDIQGEQNSAYELTDGNTREGIRVHREFEVV
ncbi:hypothetical protein EV127DRAFT_410828 [Xylaria flabelliformis]|nr:hypothetical protein EV127DRAFT_410828 [Xylaria flabelliformis]